jgi:hypothetical protein
METKFSENSEKNKPKFCCFICDYKCSLKQHFDQHCKSKKHTGNIGNKNGNTGNQGISADKTLFFCDCGKRYRSRSGLWKHVKFCNSNLIDSKHLKEKESLFKSEIIQENMNETDFKVTPKMFYDLLKQNNELQKSLIELTSKNNIGNNNIVNSQNKTFNLQFFLNETCKDALNISEFVNQIKLSISDLEETGKLGYAEGISKVFIKNLTNIDYTKRPIHCSDSKRDIIYIKDEDKWQKDEQKSTLTKAIKQVANKNIKKITDWQKMNPEYIDPDSKQNDKYMKIVLNSMSGSTKEESERNYEKIAKNIAKETIIEKII